MSIAANAPRPFPSSVRSGMFVRRIMESLVSLRACIGTMNLKSRIPKGFRLKAQGCRVLASPARTEATLGSRHRRSTTLKGLHPVRANPPFIGNSNIRETRIVTMNHLEKLRRSAEQAYAVNPWQAP